MPQWIRGFKQKWQRIVARVVRIVCTTYSGIASVIVADHPLENLSSEGFGFVSLAGECYWGLD